MECQTLNPKIKNTSMECQTQYAKMQFNIKTNITYERNMLWQTQCQLLVERTNSEVKLEPQFFAYLLSTPLPHPRWNFGRILCGVELVMSSNSI
jgi:hypothetical protein